MSKDNFIDAFYEETWNGSGYYFNIKQEEYIIQKDTGIVNGPYIVSKEKLYNERSFLTFVNRYYDKIEETIYERPIYEDDKRIIIRKVTISFLIKYYFKKMKSNRINEVKSIKPVFKVCNIPDKVAALLDLRSESGVAISKDELDYIENCIRLRLSRELM